MANSSTGSIRVHRELREEMSISRTINTGLNGPRGNYHEEKMGFLVTITWNSGITNELGFTVRITDKSHEIGNSFNVVVTTTPYQCPRNECVCTSGEFYSQFRVIFEPCVPVQIHLNVTKVTTVPTEGLFDLSHEAYLRPKKLLMYMYDSRTSTGDFLIATSGGTVFKAHRRVLESRSPIFKAMLAGNDASQSKIHLEDTLDDTVVYALIDFMYLEWTDYTRTDVKSLVKLASRYDVKDLVEACWNRLVKALNIENCVDLLILSKDFGDTEGVYKKKVGRFVVENFRDLRGTEQYAALVRDHTQLYLEICGE